MKTFTALALGTLMVAAWRMSDRPAVPPAGLHPAAPLPVPRTPAALSPAELTPVVQRYCAVCHNDRLLTGNLSLQQFDVANASAKSLIAEKMIVKLRAGMMPPPGAPRPSADTLKQLVETLEHAMDAAYDAAPNPGTRMFQRLNRAEYAASIKALLGLEIDPSAFLPIDTRSANFDNIADAQPLSPTLLDAYLRAAGVISRTAIGTTDVAPTSVTYPVSGYREQWDHVPGAPRGTRGGVAVVHNFPVDAEYTFKMWFEHTTTGGFMGATTPGEQIEISVDGVRVALVEVDRWMNPQDPNGASMATDPIFVTAGPHQLAAAFLAQGDGPLEALITPHAWSLADRNVGASGYGTPSLAHLQSLTVLGPRNPKGLSETPTRQAIFTCHPAEAAAARACAQQILTRLGTRAFRRPLAAADVDRLMKLYDDGSAGTDFEAGVRTGLQGILAMPDFVFRIEKAPTDVVAGRTYRVADVDLASRLSFFLWGAPPDDALLEAARRGSLSSNKGIEEQVRRMLADPRADALGSRFAGQWLRLEDLDKVSPDRQMFPDFHQQIADAMKTETEMFFNSIVREDRSVLDLYSANYTFVNERLARHYGILGVAGERFRKIQYPDDSRRGLFGQGSILMLTSHANRTSPVLRGKWVMEVLMGTPPPPPPPGVPTLDETKDTKDGRLLTTRERMELHRASPVCRSCHLFMDPIGLALDNFDVTGQWRIRENGAPLDTRGDFYDGTPIASPAELQAVLLKRPVPLIRTFTSNLMAYALGRRVEYYDMPEIRRIAARAEANGYRMSSFILGVVESDAFRMKRAPESTTQANQALN